MGLSGLEECKALVLLTSGHFSKEDKRNSVLSFLIHLQSSKSVWPKFFPARFPERRNSSNQFREAPLISEATHAANCKAQKQVCLRRDPHVLKTELMELIQAPPSYGAGRYGFWVFGAQDSVLCDRWFVGTRHAFFSITFLSI